MAQYHSFLLRVWRSSRHARRQWSARLEGLQDGQHRQFTDLDALLTHLRGVLDPDARAGPGASTGPDPPS